DREVFVLAYSVALAESAEQTYLRWAKAFPEVQRNRVSVVTYRSSPRVMDMVRRIVDEGGRRIHTQLGVDTSGPGMPGVADRIESRTEPDGSLTVHVPRSDQWTRPKDLLDRMGIAYEVDDQGHPIPILWELPRIVGNEWGTAMKGPDGSPMTVPNWQCKLSLEPRKDAPLLRTMQRLLDGVARIAPEPAPAPEILGSGHLLELVLPDLHFGKLAHEDETGENLDTKIIDARARGAVESLVARAEREGIDHAILIVGNDALNADNPEGTTTAGTRQDQDSRQHKTMDRLLEFYVSTVDRLRRLCPVTIYCVPGNHDRQMARVVAQWLDAWYRHDEHVTVDTSPRSRKYHRWGVVGLGWAHGDSAKPKDLPSIMAVEAPWWSDVLIREMHTGHLHRERLEEFRGCKVRELASLTGTDAWHDLYGYRSTRQADALIWHRERGLRAVLVEQDFQRQGAA
ncbi:MAG: hypothetical protein EA351_00020, partial [Gemmatimonadales bacterium]